MHSLITFETIPKTTEQVTEACKENCLVLDLDGHIAGFARFFPFRGGTGYRYVAEHTIMLTHEAGGAGHGRQMMAALIACARAQGIRRMIAAISGPNLAGVRFHDAIGFETVATLPQVGFKCDQWLDLVLMQKMI